jgi:hypothetical protein
VEIMAAYKALPIPSQPTLFPEPPQPRADSSGRVVVRALLSAIALAAGAVVLLLRIAGRSPVTTIWAEDRLLGADDLDRRARVVTRQSPSAMRDQRSDQHIRDLGLAAQQDPQLLGTDDEDLAVGRDSRGVERWPVSRFSSPTNWPRSCGANRTRPPRTSSVTSTSPSSTTSRS